MDGEQKRAEVVAGLRELADLLEEHTNMPVPYGVYAPLYLTAEQARDARKGIYGWTKYNTKTSSYMTYTLPFGADGEYAPVRLTVEVRKDEVCTRVQTGVRHVPAYDEPVYEWDCDEVQADA